MDMLLDIVLLICGAWIGFCITAWIRTKGGKGD